MGMSYALLANIPPVYGLYTSLLPPFMYLLFGTCDQLSLGVSCPGPPSLQDTLVRCDQGGS